MTALFRISNVRAYRLKYANADGYQYTYYWTTSGIGDERYSAREAVREFSLKRTSYLENALERHWKAIEAQRGSGIWELDITDWIKREALAARAKAQLPKRKYTKLPKAQRIQQTKRAKRAYRRKHIVAMRAAGTAPDPFLAHPDRVTRESAEQRQQELSPCSPDTDVTPRP